ncbi:MAG TPA: CBS domain-containing protein [Burkholderiales bacterium]|nr:CBS domain-containing protein [Burkholderiales bacterium]
MQIGEVCNREVIVTERGTSVREAAALMRDFHVGNLVVVEDRAGVRAPVGIITDRDVTIEVVAMGVDPEMVKVGEVMGPELITARETETVYDTLQRMRQHGVRRIPVLDSRGGLTGIVSLSDLLEFLAEELSSLSRVEPREQAREARVRK